MLRERRLVLSDSSTIKPALKQMKTKDVTQ
jgi:hypothetical protein